MRVGCGSAVVGIFARQFLGLVDEVVVLDDHITGVLTEHQAGRCLDMKPSGIEMRGRKSTPGRYFQVANPGNGWGGTDIADPLSIIEGWDPEVVWPGLRLLMTSTTGEHAAPKYPFGAPKSFIAARCQTRCPVPASTAVSVPSAP